MKVHPMLLLGIALVSSAFAAGDDLYEDRPWGRLANVAASMGDVLANRRRWESKDLHLYETALLQKGQSPQWPIGYGLRCAYSPQACDAWLVVAANGGAQAWLNGERVLSEHGYHRGFQAHAYRAAARLEKGWNTILVKVECPARRDFRLQFRVTPADGGPIPDLRFAPSALGE